MCLLYEICWIWGEKELIDPYMMYKCASFQIRMIACVCIFGCDEG